jgi:hypothetical protein
MRGTDATSSLLPSSSSSSASSEKTTTRNVHGLAKVAGVSIFLACSAAAAVALRGPSGTINAAHVGAEQQQQQQTSSRPLGAATPEAEEWHRLHPGFCDNMTWSVVAPVAAEEGEEEVYGRSGDELTETPFVRRAKAIAKWRVYDNFRKKFATAEKEIEKRYAFLGEDDEIPWEDSPARVYSADIVVIVQRNDAEDHENFNRIKKTLPDATSDIGVTPTEWPENIDDAEWAIEPIRKLNKEFFNRGWKHPDPVRNGDNLKNLPWLGIIDERNDAGGMTEEQYGGAHHIGCLFAHLHAWRKVLESNSGKKFSLIMEADGLNWQMKHLDAIVANVPEDADFVLLTNFYEAACAQPDEAGFCDKQGNTYPILAEDGPKKGQQLTGNFYYWPKDRSGAGFTRYLIGPKFQEKVYKYMARFGADMIDAFTFGHLCQDDYANAKMRDEGFAMPDGSDPFQKRETSRDEKNYGLKVLNCYLTDMHQDMIYN